MDYELLSQLKSKVSAGAMTFETAMDTLYQAGCAKIDGLMNQSPEPAPEQPVEEVPPPTLDPAVPLDEPEPEPEPEPVAQEPAVDPNAAQDPVQEPNAPAVDMTEHPETE